MKIFLHHVGLILVILWQITEQITEEADFTLHNQSLTNIPFSVVLRKGTP